MRLGLILVSLVGLAGCKKVSDISSSFKYALIGSEGMVPYVTEREVVVCTNDPERNAEVKAAVDMWFKAIKREPWPLVRVEQRGDDPACKANVTFQAMGDQASYAQPSRNPNVYMNTSSQWYNSFAVLVHEFGHAFGLGDTYSASSGKSGDCQAGQPQQAVMCTPQYAAPQADDIQGVRAIFGSNDNSIPDYSSDGGFSQSNGAQGYAQDSNNQRRDDQGFVSAITALSQTMNPTGATEGILFDARQNVGMDYCRNALRTTSYTGASASPTETRKGGTGINLAVISALPSQVLTVCFGDGQTCANPHAFRVLAQNRGPIIPGLIADNGYSIQNNAAGSPNATGYMFAVPLSQQDVQSLSSKKLQRNKTIGPIVSIEGILQTPNGTSVRMACESEIL